MNQSSTRTVHARSECGFTIIELMFVLAVISVLAVIAVPTYMNYAGRAKVTEGLMLAGGLKQRYAEFNYFSGGWPSNNEEIGLPPPDSDWGQFVDKLAVTILEGKHRIVIDFDPVESSFKSTENRLVFTPSRSGEGSGSIVWDCIEESTLLRPYIPKNCI